VLHQFLTSNREELIGRCRAKVALRRSSSANPIGAPLEHGIPLLIDQIAKTLSIEQRSEPLLSRKVSGPADGDEPGRSEIGRTAAQHGRELLRHGFTVDQLVHGYGDLCQSITELAFECGKPIQIDEFRTLNRCLDNAIADAVTEFSYGTNVIMAEQGMQALNERLGFLAHELRNHIHTASLALIAIKSGKVGLAGVTGAVLERSLIELRSLVDRSLADVRIVAGISARKQSICLAELIGEIQATASLEAQARECSFSVSAVDPVLAVNADRDLLAAAVSNLLQNAFKFTRPHSEVSLHAYAAADRILIEVGDCCGGLPAGAAESLFLPFTQSHADRSGLGLGLSISQRSIEANNGILRVRDIPGSGCVFTIDLPRHALTGPALDAPQFIASLISSVGTGPQAVADILQAVNRPVAPPFLVP
jgi:signal transduction histidine kinase